MPRKLTLQKTAIFKLHNPGMSKRQLLDQAFARYGEGCNLMLERCRPIAERWVRERVEGERKRPVSGYSAMKEIRPLAPGAGELELPSALQEGLISDIAGNLVSYCELRWEWERLEEGKGGEPRYPSAIYGYRPDAYYETLAEAVAWSGDAFDFVEWQSRLLREARENVRPLLYVRARDFKLEELGEGKWGVSLGVQPKGCKPTKLKFPLAFGEWHEEEYLGKGKPKCARVCRREGEYFLHVSFEFEVEGMERGEEEAYLGIDRGVVKQAAYGLVDREGRVVRRGSLGRELRQVQIALGRYRQARQKAGRRLGRRDWQRRRQGEILHKVANAVVGMAREARAQVVLEGLDIQTRGAFVRSQYGKLAKILSYKLRQAGLLPPREVFAAYSSQICSQCGEDGSRGDPERDSFHCGHCGARMDADENAGVNIARRALYKKSQWEPRGRYRAFHRSFASVR